MKSPKNKSRQGEIVVNIPSGVLRIPDARCPNGCSLVDEERKIDGIPSIKVKYKTGKQKGFVYLDPRYGSFSNIIEPKIEKGKIVEFYCPHCGVSLEAKGKKCDACGAPVFKFHLPGGGSIQGCLRCGCHNSVLKFEDPVLKVSQVYKRDEK